MIKFSNNRAFTLLEVLVAGSILLIVTAAVVGLSNSIIQGTSVNADQATAGRLASQGIELVTKIRDDTVKKGNFSLGEFVWFEPAERSSSYGWWQLAQSGNAWTISNDELDFRGNSIDLTSFDEKKAEKLSVDQIDFYRFVCVEALAASNYFDDQKIYCNTQKIDNDTRDINDGTRTEKDECLLYSVGITTVNKDSYCDFTAESINRYRVGSTNKYIPNGNAVKVRSIVVWSDRGEYQKSELSTILTNWRSYSN